MIPASVPLFKEFTVLRIYDYFKNDVRTMSFLPDLFGVKKMPNRKFILTVVSSIKPELIRLAVEKAYEAR